MVVWERQQLERELNINFYKLTCPICKEKIKSYTSGYYCKNNHGFSYIELIARYTKSLMTANDENIKYIFKSSLGIDCTTEALPCFECSKKVKLENNAFLCANGHFYHPLKYISNYIDMLEAHTRATIKADDERVLI